jgi:hypothetical protein
MIEHQVTLPAGTIKRVHIDQSRIRSNINSGENLPPITVQAQGGPYKAHEVIIDGPSVLVYNGNQLSCGARLWIESRAEIRTILVDESSDLAASGDALTAI